MAYIYIYIGTSDDLSLTGTHELIGLYFLTTAEELHITEVALVLGSVVPLAHSVPQYSTLASRHLLAYIGFGEPVEHTGVDLLLLLQLFLNETLADTQLLLGRSVGRVQLYAFPVVAHSSVKVVQLLQGLINKRTNITQLMKQTDTRRYLRAVFLDNNFDLNDETFKM